MVAPGGCTQSIGQLVASLVVGTARNPSMKEDLACTLIGISLFEFIATVVLLIACVLLCSK